MNTVNMKPRNLAQEILDLICNNMPEEALHKAKNGLKSHPGNLALLQAGHKACLAVGDRQEALRLSQILMQKKPKKADIYIMASRDMEALGRHEDVAKTFQKGLKKIGNNQSIINERGRHQIRQDLTIQYRIPISESVCIGSKPFLYSEIIQSSSELHTVDIPIRSPIEACDNAEVFICKNALITSVYGVHDTLGNPFYGTVLQRSKSHESLVRIAKYPLGYPGRILTPNIKDIAILDIAFWAHTTLCDHFGHLLTETLSCVHPLILLKTSDGMNFDLPVITPSNQNNSQGERFKNLLRSLDLAHRFLTPGVHAPCFLVRNLIVARPTVTLGGFSSARHAKIARSFLELKTGRSIATLRDIRRPKKVYISRSLLKNDQRVIPEILQLENIISSQGWHIYHPQLHSIVDQLTTYQSAEYICSVPGSALHLLYGAHLNRLKRLIFLSHGHLECNLSINYINQFRSQDLEFALVEAFEAASISPPQEPGVATVHSSPAKTSLRFKRDLTLSQIADQINYLAS